MKQSNTKITRRQALRQTAITCCGLSPALVSHELQRTKRTLATPRHTDGFRQQSRQLHRELFWFNEEITPRLLNGDAWQSNQRKVFLRVSLFLRRQLDALGAGRQFAQNIESLRSHLEVLNIPSEPTSLQTQATQAPIWAREWARTSDGQPGYTFCSNHNAFEFPRFFAHANRTAAELGSTAKGRNAVAVIQSTPIKQLQQSFANMERGILFRGVEILYAVRPTAPVSILSQHSPAGPVSWGAYSRICGRIIEQLTNNYFHQTLEAIRRVRLHPIYRPEIASHIFHILLQKWLYLTQQSQAANTV